MRSPLRFLLAVLLLAGAPAPFVACKGSPHAHDNATVVWTCPMHPQIARDKPGECPICGMKLVPIAPTPASGGAAPMVPATPGKPVQRKVRFYRSPMDPRITSPVPKKDQMGMDFVPVYEEESAGGPAVAGYAPVTANAEVRRTMGIRTAPVARTTFAATIRTVGRVAFDERRVHHVHTKYDAYVEDVPNDVNFVGAKVTRGQKLLSLYSPDLFATEQEYLLALKAKSTLGGSSLPSVAQGGADLLESARQRLLLWDLSPADIAALERTGRASRTFSLSAPMSGFVIGKMAVHGMKVSAADSLFDIADLSHVWVLADVYESELPRVAVGEPAAMTLSYWPGKSWRGAVTYVFPTLDEKTRTARVRLEFDNADGTLKPEMFADVVIEGRARTALVVPDDAVLDSGTRKIVFVANADQTLTPREVTTGDHASGLTEVLAGLKEGETVARGANFLLDSESRLKSALQTFEPPR
jgi:Cu(I)/Ag(I) efflux system membrane fusion protein